MAKSLQADVSRAYKGLMDAGIDPRDVSVTIRPNGEVKIEPASGAGLEASLVYNSVDAILIDGKKPG